MIEPVLMTEDDFKKFMAPPVPTLMKKAQGEATQRGATTW